METVCGETDATVPYQIKFEVAINTAYKITQCNTPLHNKKGLIKFYAGAISIFVLFM